MESQKASGYSRQDRRLLLSLRMTGLAVVLLSTFFLMRSITLDPMINGFFAFSAGLGFMILAAGWIPTRKPASRATTLRPTLRYERPSAVPAPALQPIVKRSR